MAQITVEVPDAALEWMDKLIKIYEGAGHSLTREEIVNRGLDAYADRVTLAIRIAHHIQAERN